MIRTLAYHSKYQNSRPVELQTKCYLARTTAPQNPQPNVSSEANSTPRVLVSGWEGFNQLPLQKNWALNVLQVQVLENLGASLHHMWKDVKSWDKQIWIPTLLYILLMFHDFHVVLCCLYLEIYLKKKWLLSKWSAKDLETTWHNQNMSIRMYSHVGFNVKQHIEPKPHGIL